MSKPAKLSILFLLGLSLGCHGGKGYADGLHKPNISYPVPYQGGGLHTPLHHPNRALIQAIETRPLHRGPVKRDACRFISKSVWMAAIKSEAMLTAITCHRQDDYNRILSDPLIKRKFRSVSVASLLQSRSQDSAAELANIQSLHDLKTYGQDACHVRYDILKDMVTMTPEIAYDYIKSKNISVGEKCKSET